MVSSLPTTRFWPAVQLPSKPVMSVLDQVRQLLKADVRPETATALAYLILAECISRHPTPCIILGHTWSLLADPPAGRSEHG